MILLDTLRKAASLSHQRDCVNVHTEEAKERLLEGRVGRLQRPEKVKLSITLILKFLLRSPWLTIK